MNKSYEELIRNIETIEQRYYRLIIMAGFSEEDKQAIINASSNTLQFPIINVSLELSSRLLELSIKQRSLKLAYLISDIVNISTKGIILDKIDLLFDRSLQNDSLAILKSISKDRVVVVFWDGSVIDNRLIYAKPNHPEYKSYVIDDFIVIESKNDDIYNV